MRQDGRTPYHSSKYRPRNGKIPHRRGDKNSARATRLRRGCSLFTALKQWGAAPFFAYYVLVIGLQGRVWNDCQGQEKRDLRLRFDALKEKTKPSACALDSHFEQALDRLGVLPLNRLR